MLATADFQSAAAAVVADRPQLPARPVHLGAAGRLTVQALVRRVDLFTLNLFLAAIEEGQICRAAAREHIAPSAATRRIQELEEIVGVRLVDRTAKGVVPSQAGLALSRHIRVLLGTLDDIRRDLTAFDVAMACSNPASASAAAR